MHVYVIYMYVDRVYSLVSLASRAPTVKNGRGSGQLCIRALSHCNQLEVFIEHIPRAERQARMHAVQLQST